MIPKKTLDLSTTPVKVFLYFTGTWIAFVHIILLNYPFFAPTLRLINVIFYVSLKVFLDIGIFSDDVNSDIPGYNLVKANHPAKAKCGVCIYFRKSLPLSILDIHFLHECRNIQMRIGNKGRDILYDQAYNASFHRKLESI